MNARVLDEIAAVVNNQVILLSEVNQRCKAALLEVPANLPKGQADERKLEIRKKTLDLLIDELLMRQQVAEHKVEVAKEEVEKQVKQLQKSNNLTDEQFIQALKMEGRTMADLRADIRKQMERSKLVEVQMRSNPEMRSQVQISEKDIEEYYRSHYATSEKVRASHILIAAPPGTKPEAVQAARAKAEGLRDQLKTGVDFGELARKVSDDPSASLGGDLGWFRKGDMVASFEKAAFGMKKGSVSGVVRTQFGFHIIKVTDRTMEDRPDLEKVRGKIQQQLYREKFQRAMRVWLDDLRRRSVIEIKL
jgi:peptidyl-prolyl cis-trans isomerase SurA